VRVLVEQDGDSGAGLSFYRFRDPTVSGPQVAFRAPLGSGTTTGVFLFTEPSTVLPVAVQYQTLGDGATIDDLTGRAAVDAQGHVACLAKLAGAGYAGGQALLRGVAGGLAPVAAAGDTGPAGGVYKSLGRPAIASNGHLAYRASFAPSTGAVTGVYLATDGAPAPYLQVGESAGPEVKGKLTGINQNFTSNAGDEIAFVATVSGGTARSAILLASRAALVSPRVQVRLAKPSNKVVVSPSDRVQLRLALRPGATSAGIAPASAPVSITLSDTTRILWTATLAKGDLKGRGRLWIANAKSARRRGLQRLSLVTTKRGAVKVAAASLGTDLTLGGGLELAPPLTVRLEVGDDSASAVLPCKTRGRQLVCR